MKKIPRMILGCTLAAALALTACSRSDSGSSGSMSTNMGGSSSQTGQAGQNAAYRTGLGILTEASDQERAARSIPSQLPFCWMPRAGWQM